MKGSNQYSHIKSLSIVGKSYARTKSRMTLSLDPIRYGLARKIPYPQRGTLQHEMWDNELDQIEDFRAAIMWYLDPLPF